MQAHSKNKLTVIFLVLLFVSPVIIAILLNSNWVDFSPVSYKNNGNRIEPAVKITDKESLKPFENYWTVVYQHSGECNKECLKMLDTLYRIRLTKGHKMKKVKLLVLHPNHSVVKIPEQYNSIELQSYQDTDAIQKVLSDLSVNSLGENKGLYILSPEGFLMMSYSREFKPKHIIDDLGLLLRARKDNS